MIIIVMIVVASVMATIMAGVVMIAVMTAAERRWVLHVREKACQSIGLLMQVSSMFLKSIDS